MATLGSVAQRHIVLHALLAGLTPLVPVPFVDDVLQARVMRRLVATLAALHDLPLAPADVRTLADPPGTSWIKDAARSVVMMPVRFVLRRIFVLLTGKRVIDLASESWHRGYLVDLAFAEALCAPVGAYSAKQVREAVDAVCTEVPVAPIAHGLKVGFEQAKGALVTALPALQRLFGRLVGEPMPPPADGGDDGALDGVLQRMLRATATVPSEHLDTLRSKLLQRLPRR